MLFLYRHIFHTRMYLTYLCARFTPCASVSGWIRDLTTEGIEPNPGHECARCLKPIKTGVLRDGEIFCSDQEWMEWMESGPADRPPFLSLGSGCLELLLGCRRIVVCDVG
jgi:hypothetical protein